MEYFEPRDLLARPFFAAIRAIFDALEAKSPVSDHEFEIARWRMQSYQSSFLLTPNFAGVDGDYEIYRFADRYYAVHRLFRGAILDRMRYLDHVEEAPVVLEAKTRSGLTKRIAEVGIGMELDRVPASAMRYCAQALDHGGQAWHLSVPPAPAMNAPSPAPPAPATSVLPVAEPAPPTPQASQVAMPSAQSHLTAAHQELRGIYKAKGAYSKRLAAWVAAVSLKSARRLLGKAA
jgi:hypothetical protein